MVVLRGVTGTNKGTLKNLHKKKTTQRGPAAGGTQYSLTLGGNNVKAISTAIFIGAVYNIIFLYDSQQ